MATTTYTISDLAKEFDLTTRAMRFYEDMGLLQPERSGPAGRSRIYSARDRTRLKLTLRAKRLGLSLTEARELIDMYDSPRDTGPQLRKFLAILAQHRRQVEEQLADLQANLEEVRAHEREARVLLTRTEKVKQASLTLTSTSIPAARRRPLTLEGGKP
ncbi:MAG: MerR family DNA-binding transcriptional regulator [Ramlibacter sp.]|nr:MerR family DNA-binding transcriptional regulator [Ramlibacter sp.]